MYNIYVKKSFEKDFRKISEEARREFTSKWIPRLQENPRIGEHMKGGLKDFWKLVFRFKKNDYRLVYEIHCKEILIIFLAIGSRESFYKRLLH